MPGRQAVQIVAGMRASHVFAALLVLAGCRKTSEPPVVSVPPVQDSSDAGPIDAGPPDAGPVDAGPPDAGPVDAGPVDAGPDAHRIGGLGAGPFPAGPMFI